MYVSVHVLYVWIYRSIGANTKVRKLEIKNNLTPFDFTYRTIDLVLYEYEYKYL